MPKSSATVVVFLSFLSKYDERLFSVVSTLPQSVLIKVVFPEAKGPVTTIFTICTSTLLSGLILILSLYTDL